MLVLPVTSARGDEATEPYPLTGQFARRPEDLGDVRVGLYTGDERSTATITAEPIIVDRHARQGDPPDTLFTDDTMLDVLPLRPEDVRHPGHPRRRA